MKNAYQNPQIAQNYLEFLSSKNGKIQQKILLDAILNSLPKNQDLKILEAACGSGWLAWELKKYFKNIKAFDSSFHLINYAKKQHSDIDFQIQSINNPLNYEDEYFDIIILNMAAPDINDLNFLFQNLSVKLKNKYGQMILTIPHPEYTYPVAEWKRSLWDFILLRKPRLKTKKPPIPGSQIIRDFGGIKINSFYHNLNEYLTHAQNNNLHLINKIEIKSNLDSQKFDLNYQLFRYPLFLLLTFKKAV